MVARQLALPHRYGRYELLARLGSGGMASVYLARARGPGGFEREVAIKITHEHLNEQTELVAGLLQEARIAARIRHPNVVPVLDVGEEEDGAFLVMEYVEGEVLSAMVRHERAEGGRLPLPIALRVLADALAGLHAAHELRDDAGVLLGIVHRDFSPQNILVGIDGVARLTDFGIARVASGSSSTRSGFIKGKLGYLSPEQVRAPRSVDRRTDVWSAGVVAWELVTGQPLRDREDEANSLLRIVSEEPPRARTVLPDLPESLDGAIARALRMDPDERLASAAELRALLVDAAMESGTPLADASEVAEYVMRIAGETLRQRKDAIRAALTHGRGDDGLAGGLEGGAADAETRAELASAALVRERPTLGGRLRWVLGAAALFGAGAGTAFVVGGSGTRAPASTAAALPAAPSASVPTVDSAPAAVSSEPPQGATATASSASARPPSPARAPLPSRVMPRRPAPPPARPAGRPALPTDPLDDAR